MKGSSGLSELVRVKEEPADPEAEPEHLPPGAALVLVKVEPLNGHHSDIWKEAECVKQEIECENEVKEDPSCSDSECDLSKAAMLADLDKHGVKDEVMPPESMRSSIVSCSDSECGVSEAAMLAGLYTDHEVKDELVLGLECSYKPDVTLVVNGWVSSVLRDCCVTLERLPHVEALVKRRQDKIYTDQESDDEKFYGANCQIQDTTHTDTESDTDELYARDKEPICDLCGESFSLKSDLLKHVIDHIHRPSSAEQEGSVHSYAFADQWNWEQERALCRKYAIRDCCVRLERLQHHEALAANDTQYTTQTDTESDTDEVHTRVDYEKLTCDLCGESFSLISDLKKHIMIHIYMPTTYQLTSPDRESDTEEKNMDIDCENEPTCEYCGEKFALDSNLMRHVMIHTYLASSKQLYENTEIHNYECDICGKIFQQKNSLKHHVQTHSTQSQCKEFKWNNIREKSYNCDICGKCFSRRSRLSRHLIIHTDERPYSCNVCEKRFKYVTHLKVHTRIHDDIRPYLCDVCKKRFRTTSDFKIHRRIHSGEKPYSCKICGTSFISSGRLNTHIRKHSGFQSYSCDVCEKQFRSATYLKIHTQNYTDIIRPYWCDVCTKQLVTA